MAEARSFYSSYQNTYTSIPGTQIKAIWAGKEMGTLQGITVSISAEKSPIFVMGHQTCRGYTTNKIGIAGSAVFLNIDRDALWDQRTDPQNAIAHISRAVIETSEHLPGWQLGDSSFLTNPKLVDGSSTDVLSSDQHILVTDSGSVAQFMPNYAAQLPEFDVLLTGIDFKGRGAFKAIRGVELINEGFSTSVDDTILEAQYTFVAREVTPWVPMTGENGIVLSSGAGIGR